MSERSFPTRRDFLAVAAGAFVVAAVPFASRRERLVRRSAPVMGTLAELAVLHRSERHAHAAMDAAVTELQRVEALMTRFRADSDVGRANLRAPAGPVAVSAETALVVQAALEWAQASDGAFDPALARLVELWDVTRRHAPPSAAQVRRLAGRRLFRGVDVDTHRGQPVLAFADADAALDLGGIACGFGVDRAVTMLRAWGITNGFINVGGDIYALGHAQDGDAWRVGVRSPSDPSAMLHTVKLSDAAVATSGDYEQHFDFGGRRYGHILDPSTGEPRVARSHTVTVVAASCLTVDAATTACFGLDRPAAERLLTRAAPGAELVHLG